MYWSVNCCMFKFKLPSCLHRRSSWYKTYFVLKRPKNYRQLSIVCFLLSSTHVSWTFIIHPLSLILKILTYNYIIIVIVHFVKSLHNNKITLVLIFRFVFHCFCFQITIIVDTSFTVFQADVCHYICFMCDCYFRLVIVYTNNVENVCTLEVSLS